MTVKEKLIFAMTEEGVIYLFKCEYDCERQIKKEKGRDFFFPVYPEIGSGLAYLFLYFKIVFKIN